MSKESKESKEASQKEAKKSGPGDAHEDWVMLWVHAQQVSGRAAPLAKPFNYQACPVTVQLMKLIEDAETEKFSFKLLAVMGRYRAANHLDVSSRASTAVADLKMLGHHALAQKAMDTIDFKDVSESNF